MQESCLKLSICANFAHGAWLSGDKHEKLRESLVAYMEEQGPEWFDDLAGELGWDADDHGAPLLDINDVMLAGAMKRRGKFAALQISKPKGLRTTLIDCPHQAQNFMGVSGCRGGRGSKLIRTGFHQCKKAADKVRLRQTATSALSEVVDTGINVDLR